VFASRRAEVLAEVPYSQVEDMEIGGPGRVRSGGGFTGGGFGLGGAIAYPATRPRRLVDCPRS